MANPEVAPTGGPRSFHVVNDGLRVAVLDWGGTGVRPAGTANPSDGSARPLVLLHPNGFCAGLFDPIARRLAAGGAFRPVGIDLRGHGATDKPDPPDPYHYEGMAGDVITVLDALGFDDVDIVGGSLGGGVAIHVDRRQPGRARRLMLCEPIAFPITAETPVGAAHPMAAGLADAPWPPVYPKMPNEPPRVAPSRAKKTT